MWGFNRRHRIKVFLQVQHKVLSSGFDPAGGGRFRGGGAERGPAGLPTRGWESVSGARQGGEPSGIQPGRDQLAGRCHQLPVSLFLLVTLQDHAPSLKLPPPPRTRIYQLPNPVAAALSWRDKNWDRTSNSECKNLQHPSLWCCNQTRCWSRPAEPFLPNKAVASLWHFCDNVLFSVGPSVPDQIVLTDRKYPAATWTKLE